MGGNYKMRPCICVFGNAAHVWSWRYVSGAETGSEQSFGLVPHCGMFAGSMRGGGGGVEDTTN